MGKNQSKAAKHSDTKQQIQNFEFDLTDSIVVQNLYELNKGNNNAVQFFNRLEILLYDFVDNYVNTTLKKIPNKYVCIHGGKTFDTYFYNSDNNYKSFCFDIVTEKSDFPKFFVNLLNTIDVWKKFVLYKFLTINNIIDTDLQTFTNENLFYFGIRDDGIMSVYLKLHNSNNYTANSGDGYLYIVIANIFKNRHGTYENGMTYLTHTKHYLPKSKSLEMDHLAYARLDTLLLEMIIHKNICGIQSVTDKIYNKLSCIDRANTSVYKNFVPNPMNSYDKYDIHAIFGNFSDEYNYYIAKINSINNLELLEEAESAAYELGDEYFGRQSKIDIEKCDSDQIIKSYTKTFSGPINKVLQILNIFGYKIGPTTKPELVYNLFGDKLHKYFMKSTTDPKVIEEIKNYIKNTINLLAKFNICVDDREDCVDDCVRYRKTSISKIKHDYFYVYSGQSPFLFFPSFSKNDTLGLIYRKGSIIYLPQFLSTTLKPDVAYSFYKRYMGSIVFKIKINKNNNNWFLIDEYSEHEHESEILLKCGSFLSVTSVYNALIRGGDNYDGNLVKIVECELSSDINGAVQVFGSVEQQKFLFNLNFNKNVQTAGSNITNMQSVFIFPNGFVDEPIHDDEHYLQIYKDIYISLYSHIDKILVNPITPNIYSHVKLCNVFNYDYKFYSANILMPKTGHKQLQNIKHQYQPKHVDAYYFNKYMKYKNKYMELYKHT